MISSNSNLKLRCVECGTGELTSLIQNPPGLILLNYSSGDGGDKKWLESKGFQVTTFDDYRGDYMDFICDGHEMPFADHQLDMVTSTAVFMHPYHPFHAVKT